MSRLLCCCFVAAACVTVAHAAGEDAGNCSCAVWIPGVGNWSNPARWNESTVPGLGPDVVDVFVDHNAAHQQFGSNVEWPNATDQYGGFHSGATTSTVYVDLSVQISSVYLGAHDTLHVLPGRTVHFGDPAMIGTENAAVRLVNHGHVQLDGDGDNATLNIRDAHTLRITGGGTVHLTDQNHARIVGATGDEMLVLEGGRIDGMGAIGDGFLGIENRGTIESSVEFMTLRIRPSSGGLRNGGVIRAMPWCRVDIAGTSLDNGEGLLEVQSAGVIELADVMLAGGHVTTATDGVVRNLTAPVTLQHITLTGNYEVGATQLTLRGGMTNDGTIYSVGGPALHNGGDESIDSTVVIESINGDAFELVGDGALELASSVVTAANAGSTVLINGAGHTIRGEGKLGNDTLTMMNRGTIDANTQGSIQIDPADGTPLVNEGTIRASGGSELFLLDGTFDNAGAMVVEDGSKLVLLPGATLTNAATGSLIDGRWVVRGRSQPASLELIAAPNLSYNFADVTLDGPFASFSRLDTMSVNGGELTLLNGHVYQSEDAFTNIGTLRVGAGSRFDADGNLTLTDDSRLELEVGADGPGRVTSGNSIALNGLLEINCTDPAAWVAGQSIELLSATNNVVGSFADVTAPGPFELSVDDGTLIVTPLALPCTGDVDGDGNVDVNDLTTLLASWGACDEGVLCNALDFNDDGVVDIADLLELLGTWGACPGEA